MSQELGAQPHEQQTNQVTAEHGSEDEAINAFNQRAAQGKEPAAETTEEPADSDAETLTDEPQAEDDAETQDGDPAEDEAEDELAEVEYEGKAYKVPPELKDAVLRKADYSRHMQEVSAQKKDYAQRLERLETLDKTAERRVELMTEVKTLDKQIAAYQGIDWAKAKADNPGEAAMAAVELMSLQQARTQALSGADAAAREIAQARDSEFAARRTDMVKALSDAKTGIKGWGDELGVQITQFALSNGWTPQELNNLTDPKVVKALDAQRRYEAAQKGRAELKAVVKNVPPVSKPGAKRPPVNQAVDAMARLRRSNSPDDAIAAFEARAKQR